MKREDDLTVKERVYSGLLAAHDECWNFSIQQLAQACLKLAERVEELEEWRRTVAYDVERTD